MHYMELADKVRYFKEDEKEVARMCKIMEDMRNESVWLAKVESVLCWIEMGLSYEQIAKGEGVSVEQVRQIAEKGQ